MRKLIVMAFAAMLGMTAMDGGSSFAIAGPHPTCQNVPDLKPGQTKEVYIGEDAAKLRAMRGAPQADVYVIILGVGKDGNGYRDGVIYAVKTGCVISATVVSEAGVINVFRAIGVTRDVTG